MMRATKDTGAVTAPAGTAVGARVVARLAKHLEVALGAVDVTPAQYRVLVHLAEGPAGASGLATGVAVTRPSVTAVVDGLVARGLVERRPNPEDRRRVGHLLTARGMEILHAADAAVEERLHELLALVEPEVAARAARGLEAWQEPLDAHRAARRAAQS
jgi:long-chain acyl-CoA synthetase